MGGDTEQFKCGHDKSTENSYRYEYTYNNRKTKIHRCKTCSLHRASLEYHGNPDYHRSKARENYQKHHEQYLAYGRQYRETHRAQLNAYWRQYRRRKASQKRSEQQKSGE